MTPDESHCPQALEARDRLTGRTIALDCRWLGLGGAGRLTEGLLERLRGEPPPGHWVLWGQRQLLRRAAWPGARVLDWRGDPRAFFGQRDAIRLPRVDVLVFPHQIRPLRPVRSLTFVLDTIPLRYGGSVAERLLKHAYFWAVTRVTTRIATVSEASRQAIARDLGVHATDVAVLRPLVDGARAERIRRLRERAPQRDVLLYVGRFTPHKNTRALVRAFARTVFARRGGGLVLVGGTDGELEAFRQWVNACGFTGVEVRGRCSDAELERLMATSRALVVPSLEEGFGLPAYEAAACGLPVAASRTGAMNELADDLAVLFDPTEVDDIACAIDVAVERGPHAGVATDHALRASFLTAVASCFPHPGR